MSMPLSAVSWRLRSGTQDWPLETDRSHLVTAGGWKLQPIRQTPLNPAHDRHAISHQSRFADRPDGRSTRRRAEDGDSDGIPRFSL
jgi:hypothetical protein